MKIYNKQNRAIGEVVEEKPYHFRYKGIDNTSFQIAASSLQHAAYKAAKYFGEGSFYKYFAVC